jgi:predicted small lipoprotein YifL
MTPRQRIIFSLLGAAALVGCGQKGALFLPGSPSDIRSEVPATDATTEADPQTEQAEAEDEDEDEDEQP